MGVSREELLCPPPGVALVRVAFSGVNYADVCIRWGLYSSARQFVGFPITPGFEFSGTIEMTGENPKDGSECPFSQGERVFGVTMFGGYSTHVLVPWQELKYNFIVFFFCFAGDFGVLEEMICASLFQFISRNQLFSIPESLTMEQAAGFPAGKFQKPPKKYLKLYMTCALIVMIFYSNELLFA